MDTYGHLFDGAAQDSAAKMELLFRPDLTVVQMEARRRRIRPFIRITLRYSEVPIGARQHGPENG